MRYKDLIENSIDIESIIESCKKKFKNLYGGNCGMFSIALGEFLEDKGIKSNIVIFCDYPEDELGTPSSVRQIIDEECKIYHTALNVNGKLYDGDGCITTNHITSWIETEYNDYDIMVYNFPLKTSGLQTLINNDTDWDISASTFYKFMVEKFS